MNNASTIRASTLREGEKRTQLQKFAQTSDPPSVNRFHTFGCPVYTLDPNLQSGNAQPNKWTDRSKVGIFPGFSREHASTVSLVLNPITELTSPQFHVKHDDRFESTKYPIMKEAGKWQEVTQIHRVRKKKNQRAPIPQRELPQQELSQRELPKINELYPLEDPQNEGPNSSTVSKQGPQGALTCEDSQTSLQSQQTRKQTNREPQFQQKIEIKTERNLPWNGKSSSICSQRKCPSSNKRSR